MLATGREACILVGMSDREQGPSEADIKFLHDQLLILLAIASRRLRDKAVAEDIVADVLVRAWRSIGSVEPERRNRWLRMLLDRALVDYHRRQHRDDLKKVQPEQVPQASASREELAGLSDYMLRELGKSLANDVDVAEVSFFEEAPSDEITVEHGLTNRGLLTKAGFSRVGLLELMRLPNFVDDDAKSLGDISLRVTRALGLAGGMGRALRETTADVARVADRIEEAIAAMSFDQAIEAARDLTDGVTGLEDQIANFRAKLEQRLQKAGG